MWCEGGVQLWGARGCWAAPETLALAGLRYRRTEHLEISRRWSGQARGLARPELEEHQQLNERSRSAEARLKVSAGGSISEVL